VSTFLLLVRIPSTRSSLSRRGGGEGHVHNYNFHNNNFHNHNFHNNNFHTNTTTPLGTY